MYKACSFNNNNKQVNYAAGPQLPTNTVSLIELAFDFNHILGTVQLALTASFTIYRPVKRHSQTCGFGSFNSRSMNAIFYHL